MIFLKLFRWLRGSVKISVASPYGERALSWFGRNRIPFWDTLCADNVLQMSVSLKYWKRIRHLPEIRTFQVCETERTGLPQLIQRYRQRSGLLIGFLLFLIGLYGIGRFVWNIRIVGNNTIKEPLLLSALSDLGVKEGVPIADLDVKRIRAQLALKVPGIAWCAVNIEGSTVSVELTESTPSEIEPTAPSNLIAAFDGTVVAVRVIGGKRMVKPGDTVRKGDLLASGVITYKYGNIGLVRAHGEVIARTAEQLSFEVPYQQKIMVSTDRKDTRRVLELPHLKIPLFLGNVTYTNYHTESDIAKIRNGDSYLPFGIRTVRFFETMPTTIALTKEAAEQEAYDRLILREKCFDDTTEIINRKITYKHTEDGVKLTAEYILEKNIAAEEKILISTVISEHNVVK